MKTQASSAHEPSLVSKDIVFAWLPVRLEEGGIAWLSWVEREVDEAPLHYLGLSESIAYRRAPDPSSKPR